MYKLLEDRLGYEKGTVVYPCRYNDYGCASNDTRDLGVEHISVTTKEDGGYPFFTVPVHLLEEVE